jgi:hypothetical protein
VNAQEQGKIAVSQVFVTNETQGLNHMIITRTTSLFCLLISAALLPHYAVAAGQQSGWMLVAPGSTEEKMGARIENVTDEKNTDTQRVEISLPKDARPIADIVVISQKPKTDIEEVKQVKRFEIIHDPVAGRAGIVLYIGKHQQIALRLNYFDAQEGQPGDPR